jgi:hypothetical protein
MHSRRAAGAIARAIEAKRFKVAGVPDGACGPTVRESGPVAIGSVGRDEMVTVNIKTPDDARGFNLAAEYRSHTG